MSEWAPIRYVQNGSVSIAYSMVGSGPVDMLFVGGFVSHLEIGAEIDEARSFWTRLASFCRLIVFDKRGMGLWDRDAGPYTGLEFVSRGERVLKGVPGVWRLFAVSGDAEVGER